MTKSKKKSEKSVSKKEPKAPKMVQESSFDSDELKGDDEMSGQSWPDASVMREILMGTLHDLRTSLEDELEKNPYKTLGIALGFGYMLGGGMPKVRNSFVWSALGRMVAKSVFRKLLASFVKRIDHDFPEDEEF